MSCFLLLLTETNIEPSSSSITAEPTCSTLIAPLGFALPNYHLKPRRRWRRVVLQNRVILLSGSELLLGGDDDEGDFNNEDGDSEKSAVKRRDLFVSKLGFKATRHSTHPLLLFSLWGSCDIKLQHNSLFVYPL